MRIVRALPALLALLLACTSARASENFTQHYPLGVNTFASGFLPAPGSGYFFDYSQYASMRGSRGGDGQVTNPAFAMAIKSNSSRLIYTWPGIKVGGMNYTTGLVLPVVALDMQIRPGLRGTATGIGDIALQNYLSGQTANHSLAFAAGITVNMPTGQYRPSQLVNAGTNHWTWSPNASVTWKPTAHWDVSGTLALEFNSTNKANGYRSGADFCLDYGATYNLLAGPTGWGMGVQGYAFRQLQDDTRSGTGLATGGNRGQVFSLGPQLRYAFASGALVLKYQAEFEARNRPTANRVWLQFSLHFPRGAR
ncbi:MAG: hypothetical protein RL684_2652 [Pseudomonadota bacterium]|jgi:hypothetical protein